VTLRTRLAWSSAAYRGLALAVEADDVRALRDGTYDSTANGVPGRPVIADPEGTEVNAGWFWTVNRVFGLATRSVPADLHGDIGLLHARLSAGRVGDVSAIAYRMAFDNAAGLSNQGVAALWSAQPEVARGWNLPFAVVVGAQRDARRANRRHQTPLATLHAFRGSADVTKVWLMGSTRF
jgi:hypothetical protein